MPYVVTVKQRRENTDPPLRQHELYAVQSRRAVAALDEAWDRACLPGIPDTTLVRERFALEEHGRCTIGPDRFGTMIEVESTDG